MYRKGSCGWGWFCFRLLNIWAQHVLVSLLQKAKLSTCHVVWIKKYKQGLQCQVRFFLWADSPLPGKPELEREPGRGVYAWRVSNVPCSQCLRGEGGWGKNYRNLRSWMLHISEFCPSLEDHFEF